MEGLIAQNVTFESLGLDRRICKALQKQGFKHPTLVQEKAIPLALQGKDIMASAKTGSGKTAAFAIPVIQKILLSKEAPDAKRGVRCAVLQPTRELCAQVTQVFQSLVAYCKLTIADLGTEADEATQETMLRDLPDIVITTPSRLLGFLKSKSIDLKKCFEAIVIDEADLTLSLGYEDDIRGIVPFLPKVYQAYLMSATLDERTRNVKDLLLHTPVTLTLKDPSSSFPSNSLLQEVTVRCADKDKFLVTYSLLRLSLIPSKVLIFVNSIDKCFQLKLFLDRFSIKAAVLNAELPRESRLHIIQQFNSGDFNFLLATDELIQDLGVQNEDTKTKFVNRPTVHKEEEEEEQETKNKKNNKRRKVEEEDEKKGKEGNGKGKGKGKGKDKKEDSDEESESDEDKEGGEEEDEEKSDVDTSIVKEEDDDNDVQVSGFNAKTNGKVIEIKDEPDSDGEKEVKEEDEEEEEKETKKDKKRKRNNKKKNVGHAEYSAARGVDFKDVKTVINFDFPSSTKSYIHRIGRTARGGEKGLAVSLISPGEEEEWLNKTQTKRGFVIPDFGFQLKAIEPFRYRCEDVLGGINRHQVQTARAETLRKEILTSKKLKKHFSENPTEREMLRNAHMVAALPLTMAKRHNLRNIPNYLVPKALASNVNQKANTEPDKPKRKRTSFMPRKIRDPIMGGRKRNSRKKK